MRKIGVLIAVLMCASVSSFGQSGLPQWKVVKEFHLSDSTTTIPPTVLFTPQRTGIYRITGYMSVESNMEQDAGWSWVVYWTDKTGRPGVTGLTPLLISGSNYLTLSSFSFCAKAGDPVSFRTDPTFPVPQDATYNLEFTIEKLTD